jgi:hypothetical protein
MNPIAEQFALLDALTPFDAVHTALCLALSFALTCTIGLVYRYTHRGASYSQGYVHTIVLMGMVVGLIMLIVGSNIARAFSLVGALSIIRFRNSMKETRDIGYIFFAMAIGMACGTGFYLLGIVTTATISLVMLAMNRYHWFERKSPSYILRIHVPIDEDAETLLREEMRRFTESADFVSMETVRNGALTEATYRIHLRKDQNVHDFLTALRIKNGNNKVVLFNGNHAEES